MKELTKHIEALLVDNDCVILPQFGGFVTNMAPARWVEEENTLLPPYRTIGFNPQLKINDGLLVQSYMITHDATYPEAARLAEDAIERLSQELYQKGSVEMHGIGTLRRTLVGEYKFDPTEDGVITPALYGLDAVQMKPLTVLEEERKVAASQVVNKPKVVVVEESVTETPVIENKNKAVVIKIKHEWIANAVGIAAAILLFFFLSTPVDNTYIEEENYASFGNISVFDQVKDKSVLTTLVERMSAPVAPETKKTTPTLSEKSDAIAMAKKTEVTPSVKSTEKETFETKVELATTEKHAEVVVPVVKAEPTSIPVAKPAEVTPKAKPIEVAPKKSASYNIIVASVPAESDVKGTIEDFAAKGYPGAFLVKGNGRFRIALKAYDTEAEAYSQVNELKQNPMFKDAWVLKTRN